MIVSLLLIGTTLNGVMHFPYALQLAYGATKLPLKINVILMVVMVPMTILLASSFGAVGGATSWALLNCIYLFIGTWLTHRLLLKGIGGKWLMEDVAIPLGVSLSVAGILEMLTYQLKLPFYSVIPIGIVSVCTSFMVTVLISPRLKEIVRNARINGIRASLIG